jgi:hypothetical protein
VRLDPRRARHFSPPRLSKGAAAPALAFSNGTFNAFDASRLAVRSLSTSSCLPASSDTGKSSSGQCSP